MALKQEQIDLAVSLGNGIGVTLKHLPDQSDVQEYVDIINKTVEAAASAPASDNIVKDEVEAVLDILHKVQVLVPDSAKGKKKLGAAIGFITAVAHMFGL